MLTDNVLVTVLTPVYNRRETMEKLYQSLLKQTCYQFSWLIIDDGSTDNLREKVIGWKRNNAFRITYYYKENGGKHTALNMGFQMADTELVFIVDSDDILTADAIQQIASTWEKVRSNHLAGMVFLKGNMNGEVIGKIFTQEGIVNDITMRYRNNVEGDKAEVWRTDILQRFQFPVYPGEKFQGENYVWWQIAFQYDMFYVNEIIYLCEYLEGGLSRSGRRLRISCPQGGMDNSRIGFDRRMPVKIRLKCGVLFNCYGCFAGVRMRERIARADGYFILAIVTAVPGWSLFRYWRKRYGNSKG